jgi:hypothetical protein
MGGPVELPVSLSSSNIVFPHELDALETARSQLFAAQVACASPSRRTPIRSVHAPQEEVSRLKEQLEVETRVRVMQLEHENRQLQAKVDRAQQLGESARPHAPECSARTSAPHCCAGVDLSGNRVADPDTVGTAGALIAAVCLGLGRADRTSAAQMMGSELAMVDELNEKNTRIQVRVRTGPRDTA